MNPVLSLLSGMQNSAMGVQQNAMNSNVMARAIVAMMSGQSPKQFLSTLPQLQGIDLNNIQQSAQNLCNQKNINYEQAKAAMTNQINQLSNNSR